MTSPSHFVAQKPTSDQGGLTVEVCKSHTIRHTPGIGILRKSDQFGAEATTYRTRNRRDEHPLPRRDSNPRFQQSSSYKSMPDTSRPPGSADT